MSQDTFGGYDADDVGPEWEDEVKPEPTPAATQPAKFEHVELAAALWRMAGGCEHGGQNEAAACLNRAAEIVHASGRKDEALAEAEELLLSLMDYTTTPVIQKWIDLYGKGGK